MSEPKKLDILVISEDRNLRNFAMAALASGGEGLDAMIKNWEEPVVCTFHNVNRTSPSLMEVMETVLPGSVAASKRGRPKSTPAMPADPPWPRRTSHTEPSAGATDFTSDRSKVFFAVETLMNPRRRSCSTDGEMIDHVLQILTGDAYEFTVEKFNDTTGMCNNGRDWNNGVRDSHKSYITRADKPLDAVS